MRSNTSISSITLTVSPVSSSSSRATPCSRVSPNSKLPPGIDHSPSSGSLPRRMSRARPWSIMTPPTPTMGRSGYSREDAIWTLCAMTLSALPRCLLGPGCVDGVDFTPVYNALDGGAPGHSGADFYARTEAAAVIRCPSCSAEIAVDEDEVKEGEILSCPECESELEVSQIHPVHLNVISEDDDDAEDDEEEDGKEDEDEKGDLIEDEEEEVEDEE